MRGFDDLEWPWKVGSKWPNFWVGSPYAGAYRSVRRDHQRAGVGRGAFLGLAMSPPTQGSGTYPLSHFLRPTVLPRRILTQRSLCGCWPSPSRKSSGNPRSPSLLHNIQSCYQCSVHTVSRIGNNRGDMSQWCKDDQILKTKTAGSKQRHFIIIIIIIITLFFITWRI